MGASPRVEVVSRRIVIQFLICRTHSQGSLQSSSITKSVSGMDCGVKSGFKRRAKAGEDSGRKYIDSLASMSNFRQL